MSLDISIQQMLASYTDQISEVDKLREILQQTALLGLARHQFFEHAAFYGGTALRILYGLDRYSEDLDFSLLKPNTHFNFIPFLEGMNKEIEAMGFQMDIKINNKNHDSGIWSAFLKVNTFSLLLSIQENSKIRGVHKEQKIQIKLEIDTEPPNFSIPYESKLVKNPIPFYVSTFRLTELFAGKMHAVLCRSWKNRIKGRDWYDLIWYIKNSVPINLSYLKVKMQQTNHLHENAFFGEKELHQYLKKRIEEIDWQAAKKDVLPFIPDKRRLDIWSSQFFQDLLEHLHIIDH